MPQSQRPPQDPKKHPGDHAPFRSNDLKRPLDGGGPGGKIPRMDRTYSGSSHSGGRHSGSGDSYDPRRSSSFSHTDRTGGATKDRSRDGYVAFSYDVHAELLFARESCVIVTSMNAGVSQGFLL